jgi:hypothetical protein
MSEEKKDKVLQDGVSRRSVLRMGSAALAAAAFGGVRAQAQTREGTHQAEGDHSSNTPEQEQATSGRESQVQHASDEGPGRSIRWVCQRLLTPAMSGWYLCERWSGSAILRLFRQNQRIMTPSPDGSWRCNA